MKQQNYSTVSFRCLPALLYLALLYTRFSLYLSPQKRPPILELNITTTIMQP